MPWPDTELPIYIDENLYTTEYLRECLHQGKPLAQQVVIDAHMHMGPFHHFHIPQNDAASLVEVMDLFGIRRVLCSHHAGISSDYRLGNDLVVEAMEKFPGRFAGYIAINPNYPEDVEAELERGRRRAMKGVKFHPELHGDYPLDGPNYRPVWRFAAEHGFPILIHTYFAGDRLSVFDRMAGEHPDATILLGHCAFDLGLKNAVELAKQRPNIVLDLTGPSRFKGVVEHLVDGVGADRIVWGSDMPFIDVGEVLGEVLLADIAPLDRAKILGLNIASLVDLPEKNWTTERVG